MPQSGVPADWHYNFTGFASHWNKNSNLGQAFDVWFLNLSAASVAFPVQRRRLSHAQLHSHPWHHAARAARRTVVPRSRPTHPDEAIPHRWSSPLPARGLALHFGHICPIVKRIWTPAWTLFSGGVCFFFLAAFSWIIDVKGYRRWAFPLVVVGMNSIAAYLIAHLWEDFIIRQPAHPFRLRGPSRSSAPATSRC